MTILFTVYLEFVVGFFFWIRRLKSSMFLGNKSILTRGAIPGKKMFNIRKKSIIFNDWSVSENQFNNELYNKIYTIKNLLDRDIT